MAKLKCTCGNGMSNSNDPNEYIISVYKRIDVENAIEKDTKIRLIDFDTLDWDYEYWYCPKCGRVHKVENVSCGEVVKRFTKNEDATSVASQDPAWEEYYIFSDVEMYDAEEEDVTLADFVNEFGESHLYFVNDKNGDVYKENANGKYDLIYKEEKTH